MLSLAQTQPWIKIQTPVNITLRQLSFVDSLTGWAAGEAGTIIRTTDGGVDWKIQNSTVQTFISDIFFLDKDLGWATTTQDVFPFKSVILKTTNGGDDWTGETYPDSSKFIRTIFFFDSLNGLAAGSSIAYTSDGGLSWIASEIDSNMVSGLPVYNFNFFNRQFGYACGGFIDQAGVIWRTTNAGLNWSAQGVNVDEVFDVYILDSLNAITLSGDPEGWYPTANIKTTNAGTTWSNNTLSFFGLSFAIDFRTYNEGWSASGYKFLLTTDRGSTWSEFQTPDSAIIYDLQFTDSRNGYAVGDSGVVLKFDPSVVGIKTESELLNDFTLYQNYPNPFNPSTKIKYTLPTVETYSDASVLVTLKVYDILGRDVALLVNEQKSTGTYEVEFSSNDLPSGIYIYQLRAGSFVQTKKMVYLK